MTLLIVDDTSKAKAKAADLLLHIQSHTYIPHSHTDTFAHTRSRMP